MQTNRQFRLTLAEKMVAGIVASRRGPGRPPAEALSRLTGKHFPYRNGIKQRCCAIAFLFHKHRQLKLQSILYHIACAYKKKSPRGKIQG